MVSNKTKGPALSPSRILFILFWVLHEGDLKPYVVVVIVTLEISYNSQLNLELTHTVGHHV